MWHARCLLGTKSCKRKGKEPSLETNANDKKPVNIYDLLDQLSKKS